MRERAENISTPLSRAIETYEQEEALLNEVTQSFETLDPTDPGFDRTFETLDPTDPGFVSTDDIDQIALAPGRYDIGIELAVESDNYLTFEFSYWPIEKLELSELKTLVGVETLKVKSKTKLLVGL